MDIATGGRGMFVSPPVWEIWTYTSQHLLRDGSMSVTDWVSDWNIEGLWFFWQYRSDLQKMLEHEFSPFCALYEGCFISKLQNGIIPLIKKINGIMPFWNLFMEDPDIIVSGRSRLYIFGRIFDWKVEQEERKEGRRRERGREGGREWKREGGRKEGSKERKKE